jgi:hypothetical protein
MPRCSRFHSALFKHDNTKGVNDTKHFQTIMKYLGFPSAEEYIILGKEMHFVLKSLTLITARLHGDQSFLCFRPNVANRLLYICLSRATEGRLSFIATYQKQGEVRPGGTPPILYPILEDTIYEEYIQSNNGESVRVNPVKVRIFLDCERSN